MICNLIGLFAWLRFSGSRHFLWPDIPCFTSDKGEKEREMNEMRIFITCIRRDFVSVKGTLLDELALHNFAYSESKQYFLFFCLLVPFFAY